MKTALLTAAVTLLLASPASAYVLMSGNPPSPGCSEDQACYVYCEGDADGQLAGTMYYNGSEWSDGVRSDVDRDVVAEAIVAAFGTACS